MPLKGWRVFLDTSALMAGIVSARGAAREVMRLGEAGVFQLVVSEQVLRELDRNIAKKFPELADETRLYLSQLALELAPDPSPAEIRRYEAVIEAADRAILAAAVLARADWLVTWNTRDFLVDKVRASVPFPVVVPAGLLEAFKEGWLKEQE